MTKLTDSVNIILYDNYIGETVQGRHFYVNFFLFKHLQYHLNSINTVTFRHIRRYEGAVNVLLVAGGLYMP